MLHALQQTQNLTPQQQSILQQLTHKCQLMQQHQQQLRMQQAAQLRAGSAPVVRSGQSQPSQQFVQGQPGFQQQHPGNRTPQGGTTAQTGFVNDGNFSPATGNTQQTAGMPFKSAGGFQPQPITSTTNSQDLSKLTAKFASISLVDECFSMVRLTSIMLAEQSENTRSSQRVLLPEDTVELFTHFFLAYLFWSILTCKFFSLFRCQRPRIASTFVSARSHYNLRWEYSEADRERRASGLENEAPWGAQCRCDEQQPAKSEVADDKVWSDVNCDAGTAEQAWNQIGTGGEAWKAGRVRLQNGVQQ